MGTWQFGPLGSRRVGWEELSESCGQPSGEHWSKDCPLDGSHIVPKEPGSRIPAQFHHWLWAAWGDFILSLNAVADLEATAEGC